ncbi:MAG: hypothetical protein PHR35_18610, partial [Kiritimatiellae bacterium]|nr:hypothetical protein [Kiritimatiellia bacterium]
GWNQYPEWTAGGGIYQASGTMTLEECVAAGNIVRGGTLSNRGGGICAAGTLATVNCLIITNYAHGGSTSGINVADNTGDGIYVAGTVSLANCTVANNPTQGIARVSGYASVSNSIVWGNGDDLVGFATNELGVLTTVGYCDIEDGDNNGTNGCISLDPLFANPAAGDYHLKSSTGRWTPGGWVTDGSSSPCIDAGDKSSPYANEPQPNGGHLNLGAYGNTAQASKTTEQGTLLILR